MTLLLGMDFTGNGKAKEPTGSCGAGRGGSQETRKGKNLTGRSQCFQGQGVGHLEEAGTVGVPSRTDSHAGDPAVTAANATPSRQMMEKDHDLSSHLALQFSILSPHWPLWKPGDKGTWEILLPEL